MDRERHDQAVRIGRAKAKAGERLTDEELKAVTGNEGEAELLHILERMKADRADPDRQLAVRYTQGTADGIRTAVGLLLAHMTAMRFHQIRKREALEDRIAALEGIVKPRVRRRAGSSPA